MQLVPKTDNPRYRKDRCQCTECGYIFLRRPSRFFRFLALLRGEVCPNCASRKTVSLAKQVACAGRDIQS